MTTVLAILNAITAIPTIGNMVSGWIASFIAAYIGQQNANTISDIQDAAALSARAQTDSDRYAAALAWRTALSKPRITAS